MSLSPEDKLAIMELVATYNFRIDHYEAEAWAELFTEDGMIKVDGAIKIQGRAGFIDFVEQRRATGRIGSRHWTDNFIIEGDGDMASMRAYIMAFDIANGLGVPHVIGEYNDQIRKIDGQWKFALRHITSSARRKDVVD